MDNRQVCRICADLSTGRCGIQPLFNGRGAVIIQGEWPIGGRFGMPRAAFGWTMIRFSTSVPSIHGVWASWFDSFAVTASSIYTVSVFRGADLQYEQLVAGIDVTA